MESLLLKFKSTLLRRHDNAKSAKLNEYLQRTRKDFEITVEKIHNDECIWIDYALFEEMHGYADKARVVFGRALEQIRDRNMKARLIIEFARFEGRQKEHERARMIFKHAIEELPCDASSDLMKARAIYEINNGYYTEKKNIPGRRRKEQLKEDIAADPRNYDAWLEYLLYIEEWRGDATVRRFYEQAVANTPIGKDKDSWRDYISIWIAYANFEENLAKSIKRTRKVYKACLDIIPHRLFTFSKIWLGYAQFELRCKDSVAAREALSQAMLIRPRNKLFRGYIAVEAGLGEFERCRILYKKFLEFRPECCTTWTKYAEMEVSLGEIDRARVIFKLAATRSRLNMPELLWDAYVAFEKRHGTAESAEKVADEMPKRFRCRSDSLKFD